MDRVRQLADFDAAYEAFLQTIKDLSSEAFLASLGDWSPRDIVAHLIGWNRNILLGCKAIQAGKEPFYHYDGPNDYRIVNAASIAEYPSRDRGTLLAEMAATKDELVAYLDAVPEQMWERDTGVVHYRGDSATVSRCVDSLMGDYRKHREEIRQGA